MKEKIFKFNILFFILAFIIGIIYINIVIPKPRNIVKYPTPYNTEKIMYKSKDDNCYKFKYEEIKCSKDAIDQPII